MEYGKSKIAAKLFLAVDYLGRFGTTIVRFLQDFLPIFARLAQIDVGSMDIVTFVLEPPENDGGIESAGISQYAAWHGMFAFSMKRITVENTILIADRENDKAVS